MYHMMKVVNNYAYPLKTYSYIYKIFIEDGGEEWGLQLFVLEM